MMLDIHSMPPLTRIGQKNPDVVIGDRFGVSAASRFSATAMAAVAGLGYEVALNHPYAGSHMLDRHGRPDRGVHALQVEVSRVLYLCPKLSEPGDGLQQTQGLLTSLVEALEEELRNNGWAIAAE
jgi:N-formylglutamate amidohydrolase